MNNLPQWYILVIGIVMPFLVEFLKGKTWTRNQKSMFALGCCVIAGLAATWITGQFNPANIVVTITVVFTISQVLYDQFFKNLFNK